MTIGLTVSMCGRYYVDDETAKEIRKLLEHLDARWSRGKQMQTIDTKGEIFPTNQVPILVSDIASGNQNGVTQKGVQLLLAKWGFPAPTGKGVLINARAETALEKRTFRESVKSRRCVVPAAGFYEWDSDKNKIYFTVPHKKSLYMAGLYRYDEEQSQFVIVTTAANESMKNIHDRMPLILDEEMIPHWIWNDQKTSEILHSVPTVLDKKALYYQQKLIF
ncbi:SOS response-associated peptidase [Anaerosporobacter faecicola]|uniref:SOS response-associated peptidase n=1 Tax=Anaerosporobacter faecicola TaxID=2718714 RepID=UPI001EE5CA02|nr:SOS response-associated peptidase [Anaerosporobacter faecicola]